MNRDNEAVNRGNETLPESKGRLSYCDFAFPSSLFLRVTISWDRNFFASTVGERTPHKSTPFRAASYFRPDPVRGSPSRSPLTNSFLTHSFIKCGANSQTGYRIAAFLAPFVKPLRTYDGFQLKLAFQCKPIVPKQFPFQRPAPACIGAFQSAPTFPADCAPS